MNSKSGLLKRIKDFFNKEDHQVLSVTEFNEYMGLNPDEVLASIY